MLRQRGGHETVAATVTAIDDAVKTGDLEKVKTLLESNPQLVFSNDSDGLTPLHLAAVKGYRTVAELLLSHGAEVNAKNKDGFTPLHVAAFEGHKDVVKMLLANKAEVNARDSIGSGTPFHYASLRGQKDVAKLLRQHGGHE
jgi:cytohesin